MVGAPYLLVDEMFLSLCPDIRYAGGVEFIGFWERGVAR